MKYTVEMGSGAMIKDWFRHSKVVGGIHRHTDNIILLLFSQNKGK
jgi:hypothetical protein